VGEKWGGKKRKEKFSVGEIIIGKKKLKK